MYCCCNTPHQKIVTDLRTLNILPLAALRPRRKKASTKHLTIKRKRKMHTSETLGSRRRFDIRPGALKSPFGAQYKHTIYRVTPILKRAIYHCCTVVLLYSESDLNATCCGCGPANGLPLLLFPPLRLSPPVITLLLVPVGVVVVLGGSGGADIAGIKAGGGGGDRKGFGSSSSGLLNVINASSRLDIAIALEAKGSSDSTTDVCRWMSVLLYGGGAKKVCSGSCFWRSGPDASQVREAAVK